MGATTGVRALVRSAWGQRDLAIQIAVYDHRAENQGFVLGGVWHFLSPLLRIGVYALVFGLLLAGRRPPGFVAFLAVGLFVFGLLQSVVQKAGTIFDARQSLLTALHFSRVLLPVSVIIRQLLEFRFEALVMVVAILATNQRLTLGWIPFLLVLVPVAMVFALGLALLVAVTVARFRDVSKLVPIVFRMLFYLSGVLFPIAALLDDHPTRALLPLNPFYVYVALARHLVLEPDSESVLLWGAGLLWAASMLAVGLWLFARSEHRLVRP